MKKLGYDLSKNISLSEEAKAKLRDTPKWSIKLGATIGKEPVTAARHLESGDMSCLSIPAIILIQNLTGLPDHKLFKING